MSRHLLTIPSNNKIAQIKALRQITGLGLKDAKHRIEEVRSQDQEVTLIVDLPYTEGQRTVVEKGMEALGYNITLTGLKTRIADVGYFTVHWPDNHGREPWEIEVLHAGEKLYYREMNDQRWLHPLSGMWDDEYDLNDAPSFAPSTAERFNKSR
jgi:hypothetical protein